MSIKYKSTEPFLYGKRIKAVLTTYENEQGLRSIECTLFTYGNTPYKKKLFFDNGIAPTDCIAQNELYRQAYEYCNNWLNTCKY